MLKLAVIGLGGRISGMIKAGAKLYDDFVIAAVADPNETVTRERLEEMPTPGEGARYYPDADALLKEIDDIDGFLIGTRCDLHTRMALKVAPTHLPLLLEKPVAITEEEVTQLAEAFRGQEEKVVISFPLRVTPLFTAALDVIRSGRLGRINQVQAINNVPYGGVYFGQWYRDTSITGGQWLQKATHDLDYINLLAGSDPKWIAAMESQLIYGGDKPFDLKCSECDETVTCPDSPRNLYRRGNPGGMGEGDHACAFSEGIENHDAGSCLVSYASGVHASYSQNFVTRLSAGKRGAIVTGYDGSLEFDWYTQKLTVTSHREPRVDRIEVDASTGHGGGDSVLWDSFMDVVRGRAASISDLHAGLLSASMCLAARRSCRDRSFQAIEAPSAQLVSLSG